MGDLTALWQYTQINRSNERGGEGARVYGYSQNRIRFIECLYSRGVTDMIIRSFRSGITKVVA